MSVALQVLFNKPQQEIASTLPKTSVSCDRQLRNIIGILSVFIVLQAIWSSAAHAQATTRSEEELLGTLDADMTTLKPGEITLDLGAGPLSTTRIDASATKLYPIVPYVSFRYKDWFALDENEARVNILRPDGGIGSAGWRAGPMIKVDLGRGRFGNADLQSLPPVDTTLEVGGFVSYTVGPARIRVNVRGDATGAYGGAIAELEARSGFYQSGRLSLAAEIDTTWVSKPYMNAFYGVTVAQAPVTGLPPFDPNSGMRNIDLSLMGQFQFTRRWSVIAVTQYSRLLGPAAASPLTIRLRAANRFNTGTFIVYTF